MAVINSCINRDMVRTLAGIVDFYMVKGQARARAWPKRLDRKQTPQEIAAAQAFGVASASAASLQEIVRDMWRLLGAQTDYAWRDLYLRHYIRGDNYEWFRLP